MKNSKSWLKIITGGNHPKRYAKQTPDEAEQIVCRTCEIDTGVASSLWIEGTMAPRIIGNHIKDGTETLICVHCLSRGKVTKF